MTQEEVRWKIGMDIESVKAGTKAAIDHQRHAGEQFKEIWHEALKKVGELFAAEKLIEFGKTLIENADLIDRTASRLNLTTEAVQRMNYAAAMADSSIESLAGAFDKLAKSKETALGGDDKSKDAFADFGISMAEVNALEPDKLFSRIAESIEKTGINAKVTADMMALFGKTAGELKPLMLEYSKNFREAFVIPEADIKNLAELDNGWKKIWSFTKMVGSAGLSIASDPSGALARMMTANTQTVSLINESNALLKYREEQNPKPWKGAAANLEIDFRKQEKDDAAKALAIEKEIAAVKKEAQLKGITIEKERLETLRQIRDIEYRLKGAEFEGLNQAEIAQLRLDREKLIVHQKELQAKMDTEATKLAKTIGENQRQMAEAGAQYNTIENIAGRRWSKQFAAKYGVGGEFDLGRGTGPMAETAREFLRAKYQQQYDRTYLPASGDYFNQHTLAWEHFDRNVQINADKQRYINARDTLINNGQAGPDLQLEKMRENTDIMARKLADLIGGGAIIKTSITDE